MGLANMFGGIGQMAQQQNLQQAALEHDANEHMAQAIELMGQSAKPQYQDDYTRLALQYRMLKPGQKPGKDMDLHGLMMRQLSDTQQQQQQAQQKQQQGLQTSQQIAGQPSNSQVAARDAANLPVPPGAMPQPPPATAAAPAAGGVHPTGVTGPVQGISLTPPPSGAGGSPPNPTGPVPGASGTQGPDGATPLGGQSPGFGAPVSAQALAVPQPPAGQEFSRYTMQELANMKAQSGAYGAGLEAQTLGNVKRAQTGADIQAQIQRIMNTPDLKAAYLKLDPMQQVEMIMQQPIQRSLAQMIPHEEFGPMQLVTPQNLPSLGTDYFTGQPFKLNDTIKPVIINGHQVGNTNALLGSQFGTSTSTGQWYPVPGTNPVQWVWKEGQTTRERTPPGNNVAPPGPVPGAEGTNPPPTNPSNGTSAAPPAGGSSAANRPPAPPSVKKDLTPEQQMDNNLKAGALDNTIDLVKSRESQSPAAF